MIRKLCMDFREKFTLGDHIVVVVDPYAVLFKADINGKARVVFGIAGHGDVLFRIFNALFCLELIPNLLLTFHGTVRGVQLDDDAVVFHL